MKGGQSHYFDKNPAAPHDYGSFEVEWEDRRFVFQSDSGVFSRRRLDPGTDLLVKTALKELKDQPGRLLDLGTGVGVMAIALASLRPSLYVTASDINRRALDLTRVNARAAGVDHRLTLVEMDGVPRGPFDCIVTNPPIRAGKDVLYRLFRQAADNLNPDGCVLLVIRVKQGAASAARELERSFARVLTVARGKGYHVLKASGSGQGREGRDS